MSHARNALVVRSVDVIIAIDGEHGTLSEIALGLNMGIPVVGLKTWDIPGVVAVQTAPAAVERALELIEKE
jgi:predicted Rossmann-fold nucleotide-binding protein